MLPQGLQILLEVLLLLCFQGMQIVHLKCGSAQLLLHLSNDVVLLVTLL